MRLSKNQRSRRPAPLLIVPAALALGAVAAAYLRRRPSRAEPVAAGPRPFRCECGQELRVSGVDRHRVFWLPDASAADPLLGDRCPNCDRSLVMQG